MSHAKNTPVPAEQLAEHLRFLREIGVKEIRVRRTGGARADAGPASKEISAPASAAAPARTSPAPPPASLETPRPPSAAPKRAPSPGNAARLAALSAEEIGDCQRCRLCKSRTNIVFGVGNPEARLMFVGEGPGRDEDAQGIPFVGRAGQLLTDIIKAMKLTREQVYIANIVKCRPPENRTPEPDEIEACRGFLEAQIGIIAPAVIVCLGAVAAHTLLGTTLGITKIRGQVRELNGIPVMPTYHPAYLLRSPNKKRDVWEDMKQVMGMLGI